MTHKYGCTTECGKPADIFIQAGDDEIRGQFNSPAFSACFEHAKDAITWMHERLPVGHKAMRLRVVTAMNEDN